MSLKDKIKKIEEKIMQKAIRDFSCCSWGDEELTEEEVEALLKKIDDNIKE